MKALGKVVLLLLLLAVVGGSCVWAAEGYPARCRVTTNLNVRSCASKGCQKIGLLHRNEYVTVEYTTGSSADLWGVINYGARRGYVSMRYVQYINPIEETAPQFSNTETTSGGLTGFFEKVWNVLKWILIILAVLIVLAFWEEIISLAVGAAFFAGAGAAVFAICGGSGGTGALVGLGVAALVGVRLLLGKLDISLSDIEWGSGSGRGLLRGLFLALYYTVSFPIYYLNRLEHFLVSPWRYVLKTSWVSESVKPTLRVVLEILTVVMYVVTTPLRLFNAIVYNILIHCVTGIYDLLFEVFVPCDDEEGADGVWMWIAMFPWRLIKYPIWHGFLLVVESAVWTVVDIFVPAVTLYHGTDLVAGEAITRDPHRNRYLKDMSSWTCGTFTASSSSWGGIGVYFASQRSVASGYAHDPWRLSDSNPVVIACRVSLGRIINYALTPYNVYCQAGQYGKHSELNRYGERNGYTTGEWWNGGGHYWEYCLFDWQNRYNHPWRIRPIYVLNFRTGRAQHISGGMQHWLFDKAVLDDLLG